MDQSFPRLRPPRLAAGSVRPTTTPRGGGRVRGVVLLASQRTPYAVAEGGDLDERTAEGGGDGGGERGGVRGDLLDVRRDRVHAVELGLGGPHGRGRLPEQRHRLLRHARHQLGRRLERLREPHQDDGEERDQNRPEDGHQETGHFSTGHAAPLPSGHLGSAAAPGCSSLREPGPRGGGTSDLIAPGRHRRTALLRHGERPERGRGGALHRPGTAASGTAVDRPAPNGSPTAARRKGIDAPPARGSPPCRLRALSTAVRQAGCAVRSEPCRGRPGRGLGARTQRA